MTPAASTFSSRIRWMPVAGLLVTAVVAARALFGPHPLPAAAFIVGGVVGGVLVAALYPLSRWLLGSTLLGMIAVSPAYIVVFLTDPTSHSLSEALLGALFCIVAIGGVSGFRMWFSGRSPAETPHWIYGIRYPTGGGMVDAWGAAVIAGVIGWVIGMHWVGQMKALIGLPIILLPLGFALAVTIQWAHHLSGTLPNKRLEPSRRMIKE